VKNFNHYTLNIKLFCTFVAKMRSKATSIHAVVLWLLGMVSICQQAVAQYDVAFNEFWALQSFYNPAASGVSGLLDVHGGYSMQLKGYENAPVTMIVTADLPLWMIGPAHGIGTGFINDKIGLFEHKKIYLQYAYHQKLFGGRLSAGLRGALMAEGFDGSGLDTEVSGDPVFPTSEVNGTAFDLDAGLRFDARNWYVGFSAFHILNPLVELGDDKINEYEIPQTFYLTGGYNIRFRNPLLSVQTAAIVRTDMKAWRGDINARLIYRSPKGRLYAGLGYSPTISVSAHVGGDFHGIQIGYCYEMYTGGIGIKNGTHEINIGYATDLNLFKKGKNRHQSVRIL